MTDPEGQAFTTRYRYEELNKLVAVDERPRANANTVAGVTRFFYDPNRNKIAQQDANRNLVTYRYDGLNRLTHTLRPTMPGCLTDTTTHTIRIKQPPTAIIITPATAIVDQSVDFDASGSVDEDGQIEAYDWDFGDGATGTGITVTHLYSQ